MGLGKKYFLTQDVFSQAYFFQNNRLISQNKTLQYELT
jgi:hypothetical protein